jgi:hypothetical protein
MTYSVFMTWPPQGVSVEYRTDLLNLRPKGRTEFANPVTIIYSQGI